MRAIGSWRGFDSRVRAYRRQKVAAYLKGSKMFDTQMFVHETILNHGSLFPKIDSPDYRSWNVANTIFLFNKKGRAETLIKVSPNYKETNPFSLIIFHTENGKTTVYYCSQVKPEKTLRHVFYELWQYALGNFRESDLRYFDSYEHIKIYGSYDHKPKCLREIQIPDSQDRWDKYRIPLDISMGQALQHLGKLSGFPVSEDTITLDISDDSWYEEYQDFPDHIISNPANGRSVSTRWGSDQMWSEYNWIAKENGNPIQYVRSEESRPFLATIHSWLLGV